MSRVPRSLPATPDPRPRSRVARSPAWPLLLAGFSGALSGGACDSGEPTRTPTPSEAPAQVEGARASHAAGVEAASLGRMEEALAAYRKALELDPEFARAHFALGCALIPSASLAVGATTEDPDPARRAVKIGMNRSVLEEGIAHLRRATELEPENAEFLYWLGRALHVDDRDAQAIAALERALALDPEHGQAEKRLGLIYLDQGETQGAERHLTAALALLPEDAGVPFQLGNLLLEADPAGARVHFERAIAIDPTLPWAHHNLSLALARLGDEAGSAHEKEAYENWKRFDAELAALVERANKRAEDPAAQIEAGEHLYAAGRMEGALKLFRRALLLAPEDPLAHLYCGIVLRKLGDPGSARAHLERSAALDPSAVQPQIELARASADLGDEARVAEILARLRSLVKPEDPDGEFLFAQWLLERGLFAEAGRHFEAVLAVAPENAEAREGLSRSRGGERP